jgi:hypothetical protein
VKKRTGAEKIVTISWQYLMYKGQADRQEQTMRRIKRETNKKLAAWHERQTGTDI